MKRRRILITAFSLLLVLSCKKDTESVPDPNPTPTPVFTPLVTSTGVPSGASNSMTIGTAGGTILSDDGRMEITFPANALAANTDISIQPVTNFCPAGVGQAFDLMPHGMVFNQPVEITFHYTESEIVGSAPAALAIATQQDDQIWYKQMNSTLDEVNSSVTINTMHFSNWALLGSYSLTPWAVDLLEVNESQALVVYNTPTGESTTENGQTQAPLGAPAPLQLFQENITWSVNSFAGGTTNDGYVNPPSASSSATYTAPAHIANMTNNPAAVAATIDFGNGAFIDLTSQITVIEPGQQYILHFIQDYSTLNYTTPFCQLNSPYNDGFDVHLTISDEGVVVNELTNMNPLPAFHTTLCNCEDMVFDQQGSLIEFSNFVATNDGTNNLYFTYNFSWNGSDDTYTCEDVTVTTDGTDFSDSDLGNCELPSGEVFSIESAWGIGTLTVTKVQ